MTLFLLIMAYLPVKNDYSQLFYSLVINFIITICSPYRKHMGDIILFSYDDD